MIPAGNAPDGAVASNLLDASVAERSRYFKSICVSHPRFDAALRATDRLLNPCLDQRFVLLVGPTGVGKTAVARAIVFQRIARQEEEMIHDHRRIPAIFVEAEAPDEGSFSFRRLHFDMLAELHTPLIEDSLEEVTRDAGMVKTSSVQVEFQGRKATKHALRQRLRLSLRERNVEVCCIDEARHIFAIGKERYKGQALEMYLAQATKLKSLINKTPTSLLLAGAYDFFALSQASGQLARRTRLVHLEPYGTSRADMKGFCIGLDGLLCHLPALHGLDLASHSAEICLHTAGCIGVARDLLHEALVRHCEDGVPLDIDLLRHHYLSASALMTMRAEMTEGARQVNRILSNEELITSGKQPDRAAESQRSPAPRRRALKPGEGKPSHRAEATRGWEPPT